MPRPIGRPSKLTEETIKTLTEALGQGDTFVVACAEAGVTYSSFRRWMVRGEMAAEGEFHDFYDAVREAEMVGRREMERRAFKESKPLEYLERRHPEDWGRKDRADVLGDIRVTVEWATDKDKKEAEG